MTTMTWNQRSYFDRMPDTPKYWKSPRYAANQPHQHVEEVVEDPARRYIISHAGLLQRRSGFRDYASYISKGVLLIPLVLIAIAIPVLLPALEIADYLLVVIGLIHLLLVSTVLTVWAIAVSYLDVKRGEEGMEARPMTAADGDPSMGARTLPVRKGAA